MSWYSWIDYKSFVHSPPPQPLTLVGRGNCVHALFYIIARSALQRESLVVVHVRNFKVPAQETVEREGWSTVTADAYSLQSAVISIYRHSKASKATEKGFPTP